MLERRREPRRAVRMTGRLEHANRGSIPCIVHDVSIAGASLEVASAATVPDRVTLVVAAADMRLGCRVVWRNGTRVGLAFDD